MHIIGFVVCVCFFFLFQKMRIWSIQNWMCYNCKHHSIVIKKLKRPQREWQCPNSEDPIEFQIYIHMKNVNWCVELDQIFDKAALKHTLHLFYYWCMVNRTVVPYAVFFHYFFFFALVYNGLSWSINNYLFIIVIV